MGILLIAILMATMSTTRSNASQLSKSIEDELNRFSKTETSFSALETSGNPVGQEYVIPEGQSGWYRIELWGTQGGPNGGNGAYTSGVIKLEEGNVLYFYVGKKDSGRGKETDVRILNGGYNDPNSYGTRIMVAAGGGTGAKAGGGTLYGYSEGMYSKGAAFVSLNDSNLTNAGTNGTLVGYPTTYTRSTVTQTAAASPVGTNGGGDGYYASNNSGVGGVSFISGYAGSKAIINGAIQNSPLYTYTEAQIDEETGEAIATGARTAYYFLDGMMLPGVNIGDGHARIERLVFKGNTTELPKANTKFNAIKEVKDCVANPGGEATKIAVIQNGNDIAANRTLQADGTGCRKISLGGYDTKVDEIAVWHEGIVGQDLKNHSIQVMIGSEWKYLKKPTELSETETVTGTHISAYQYDSTENIPTSGNYYIIPVTAEGKVLTAPKTLEEDSNPIALEPLQGFNRQKWSIEVITDTKVSPGYNAADPSTYEFKILELARYKSFNIISDENKLGNAISSNTSFNNYARNGPQIWKISSIGDGTYTISTPVAKFEPTQNTGNLMVISSESNGAVDTSYKNRLIIGINNNKTQRFKLVKLDY